MKSHKNFGIAAAICMSITVFTGMNEDTRKTHGFWACLTVFFLLGAIVTGKRMVKPKKNPETTLEKEQ